MDGAVEIDDFIYHRFKSQCFPDNQIGRSAWYRLFKHWGETVAAVEIEKLQRQLDRDGVAAAIIPRDLSDLKESVKETTEQPKGLSVTLASMASVLDNIDVTLVNIADMLSAKRFDT